MEKKLFANPDKCTGCSRCAYACSAQKVGAFAPSRGRVFINNFPARGYSVPSICFQCPSAPCQKSCPVGAMSRDENDVVVIDADKCNGCGACVEACPYGMVALDASGAATKCDYCGGDPVCVKECYSGALLFEETAPELVKLKAAQMKQRSQTGAACEKRHRLGSALLEEARS